MIIDGIGAGAYTDLDIFSAAFPQQVHIRHNPYGVSNFVGKVLKELLAAGHANDRAVILYSDINMPALRVGKTADPFQVFVPPGFLILDVLIFRHAKSPVLLVSVYNKRGF